MCKRCGYSWNLTKGNDVCNDCAEDIELLLDLTFPNRVKQLQPIVPIWTLDNIPDSGEPF